MGDGYSQDSPDGLNNIRQVWTVSWERGRAERLMPLYNFLIERGGWQAFEWTPPGATAPLRFLCKSISKAHPYGHGIDVIEITSLKFEQVFR